MTSLVSHEATPAAANHRVSLSKFSVACGDLSVPSGGSLQESGREMVLVQLDRRSHHGLPELGDAPAARARDLGDESPQVEAFDEARDLPAAAAIGRGVG